MQFQFALPSVKMVLSSSGAYTQRSAQIASSMFVLSSAVDSNFRSAHIASSMFVLSSAVDSNFRLYLRNTVSNGCIQAMTSATQHGAKRGFFPVATSY